MSAGSSSRSSDSFVHLHVHTEYSMLDGASLLDGLFSRTSELGMPAIAMTDHGNLHGAYDFYSKARKHRVKPIIGIEAYITPGTQRGERRLQQGRRHRPPSAGGGDGPAQADDVAPMPVRPEQRAERGRVARLQHDGEAAEPVGGDAAGIEILDGERVCVHWPVACPGLAAA